MYFEISIFHILMLNRKNHPSVCSLSAKSVSQRWHIAGLFEISYTRCSTSRRSKFSDKVGFLRLRHWLVEQRFKFSNAYISFICE